MRLHLSASVRTIAKQCSITTVSTQYATNLLNVLLVLSESGSSNAAQLTAGQHRLEQIASIHSTACGSCSYYRVYLINEGHYIAATLSDLFKYSFKPLLELACARQYNQSATATVWCMLAQCDSSSVQHGV
jgi:hypothetical protein